MKFVKWLKKYANILTGKGMPSRKLIRSAKGSVTIFLLVIMFPMLVFSFSVMDLCKIFMAKDMIESATDIALRSAMTAYDDVLKDMYGIFATSKSDSELTAGVLKYYEATLKSCGVTDDEAGATVSFIESLFKNNAAPEMNDNDNFLRVFPGGTINGTEKNSLSLTGVKESAASNPTVLHREIVEYMKYRGPVVMTVGLFEKINAFKDLSNQTTATTKRMNYEKEASKLGNNAILAYSLLKLYEDNNRVLAGGNSTIGSLPYVEEKYRTGLINSGKYAYSKGFSLANLKTNSLTGDGMARSVDRLRLVGNYILSMKDLLPGYISNGNRLSLITLSANNEYEYDLTGNMDDAYTTITNGYDFQGLYAMLKNNETTKDLDALAKVCTGEESAGAAAEQGFQFLKSIAPLYKSPSSSKPEGTALTNVLMKFISIYEKIERDGGTIDEKYTTLYNQIKTAETAAESYVKSKYSIVEEIFNGATSDLNMQYDAMIKQIRVIDILTGESTIPYDILGFPVGKGISLMDIYNQFASAQQAAKDWGTSIENIQTDNQKNSQTAQFKSETDGLASIAPNAPNYLKKEDVQKMIDKLKKQRAVYAEAVNSMKNIVFLKGQVIDASLDETNSHLYTGYTELEDFVEKMPNTLAAASAGNIEANKAAEAVQFTGFASTISWEEWNQFIGDVTDNEQNPFFKQIKKMSKPGQDEDDEKVQKQKENGKDIQNKINDNGKVDGDGAPATDTGAADEAPVNDSSDDEYLKDIKLFRNYYSKDKTPPSGNALDQKVSGLDSGDNDAIATNAATLMGQIGNMFAKLAGDLGEGVLVTEYINKQFSCYTTNMDGKGHRYTEKDKQETMLTGMPFYDADTKKANVVWYGAEQEYILYGNDSKDANLAIAYASIFAIRFVLNLIYSYTDTEIRSFTLSVATAIGGIFPLSIPLIQTVLHIALSLAESTYDMVLLRGGAEVPIYKTATTWACKGSNIVRNITADAIERVSEKVVDKVSDGLVEAINNANGKAIDFTTQKIDGFEGLVQSELDKMELQVQTDIITPLQSVVQQAMVEYEGATESFKDSLRNSIDDLCTNLENSIGTGTDDSSLDKAERMVLDHLKTHKETYINTIVNHIEEYISLSTSVSSSDFDQDSYEGLGKFAEKFKSDFSDLFNAVKTAVNSTAEKVKETLSEALNELATKAKDGVEYGADAVKDKVGEFANKIRGQGHLDQNISFDSKQTNTSSTINMSYKDYLNIFMVISVITGDTNQLERAAKLMTANVRKQTNNTAYDLNEAHTLIKAESAATVRTVFFGSVLEDGKLKPSTNPHKYSFDHTTYLGY